MSTAKKRKAVITTLAIVKLSIIMLFLQLKIILLKAFLSEATGFTLEPGVSVHMSHMFIYTALLTDANFVPGSWVYRAAVSKTIFC